MSAPENGMDEEFLGGIRPQAETNETSHLDDEEFAAQYEIPDNEDSDSLSEGFFATIEVIHLPDVAIDEDGNFLGFYPNDSVD
jgi:hypothetical protein